MNSVETGGTGGWLDVTAVDVSADPGDVVTASFQVVNRRGRSIASTDLVLTAGPGLTFEEDVVGFSRNGGRPGNFPGERSPGNATLMCADARLDVYDSGDRIELDVTVRVGGGPSSSSLRVQLAIKSRPNCPPETYASGGVTIHVPHLVPHIDNVDPPDVREGGPVTFEGENLAPVHWAILADEGGRTVITDAEGKNVGNLATSKRPPGLAKGPGKVWLSTAEAQDEIAAGNTSNSLDIVFEDP
ncbi:hypothetical protein [Streptomyces sp. CBMA156]|uniref:hypothetical protein n=1 Tax=Streptomyces sp. CBMA156 TaxID=1930280 RepID=UPI001661C7EB|nr:hypothetical protein [Streptomyces sp. CBMA156]MBD0672625.1 hypothetical protein [Streptomyces sp. CBMA156]